jgi:hypothetical protein
VLYDGAAGRRSVEDPTPVTKALASVAWVPQLLGRESARMWVLSWANGCGPGDASCH